MAKASKKLPPRKTGLDFRQRVPEATMPDDTEKGAEKLVQCYLRQPVYLLFKKHCAGLPGPWGSHLNRVVAEYLRSNGVVVPDPPPRKNANLQKKGGEP